MRQEENGNLTHPIDLKDLKNQMLQRDHINQVNPENLKDILRLSEILSILKYQHESLDNLRNLISKNEALHAIECNYQLLRKMIHQKDQVHFNLNQKKNHNYSYRLISLNLKKGN